MLLPSKAYKAINNWFVSKAGLFVNLINFFTVVAFSVGLIALAALIWLHAWPIKLADIKVPVATDQASYHPGEEISGIFFGEIFYKGDVRVLREVYCKDYKNIIEPPDSAQNGDFYDTQSIPRRIEGLSVNIGLLPENIPVGSNCVLQFTNVYDIKTPLGTRHEIYQYYTQNFSIVTRERRQQLECEASGSKDCNFLSDSGKKDDTNHVEPSPNPQESVDSTEDTKPPQNVFNDNRTTNNTTNNPTPLAEPAPRLEERCTVDFIIKINCRQVPTK